MPDVLIRNLRLRIVRVGTLFWSEDPRLLARRALGALPGLFAEQLDGLGVSPDQTMVLPGPVRLRIRGTLPSLSAALRDENAPIRLRSMVKDALQDALVSSRTNPVDPERPDSVGGPQPATVPIRSALGDLLPLCLAGELPARLRRMDPGLVEAYHRLLLVESPAVAMARHRVAGTDELREAASFIEALAAGFAAGKQPRDAGARLRERIIATVTLAAQTGIHPFDSGVRSLLDRLLPLEPGATGINLASPAPVVSGISRARDSTWVVVAPEPAPELAEPIQTAEMPRRRRNAADMERVAPMLPLLAASLLSRRGAMAIIGARLQTMGREGVLPLWIAGLAFKLGPMPARGWMYSEDTWQRVAAVADCALVSGESLAHLADDPRVDWRKLSGAMLDALGEGTRPGAMHREEAAPEASATLPLLACRPACALARTSHFDHHISTAAAWALDQVGRALWPGEGPPIQLAFERLISLEGHIQRDDTGVLVRVPLGKRHADLLHAGLLADVPKAPWVGRASTIRFRGG